jgi:hypothetical protein
MAAHLAGCLPKVTPSNAKSEKELIQDHLFLTRALMNMESLEEQVLQIIIEGDLSFNHAHNNGLIRFVKTAYPKLSPPTAKRVKDCLTKEAAATKEHLKDYFSHLNAKVSIAMDGWNSRNGIDYLGTSSFELYRAI